MLIVQKYGGATLATPAQIRAAAERISRLRHEGHQVVAIVSAMGQTTNDLISLARQVSDRPALRELDMLLTTGERVSMALLTMALEALQCPAISFTGSQAGILTDESHVNALIKDIKAFRVSESLQQGKVVVLAGFQGVSPLTKEITTLGRGGTDTTAVAMSIFLKADRCEILKEVPAVFTADPRLVPSARPLAKLRYSQLAEMCFWGAKVLHYRSVELAARHQVPLYVGPAMTGVTLPADHGGTLLFSGGPMYESTDILALNSHEKVALWKNPGSPQQSLMALQRILQKEQIPSPQILAAHQLGDQTELMLTGPSEVMDQIEALLPQISKGLASVSCTCTGTTSLGLMEKISARLESQGLRPERYWLSAQSVNLLVSRSERVQILQSLHNLVPTISN